MLHSYSIRYLPITLHFASAENNYPDTLPALHYLKGSCRKNTYLSDCISITSITSKLTTTPRQLHDFPTSLLLHVTTCY